MTKNKFTSVSYLLVFLLAGLQLNGVRAQIIIEEEGKRLYYDRTRRVENVRDMKDFRDVFHKDKYLLGKKRIMGNISYNTGRVLLDDVEGQQVKYEVRNALGFYTRIRFLEEFSINTTFYLDFNKNASARWISNYTYAIGRYNWRPNKFNFGYENYLNNRYSDTWKQMGEKFMEGYYFISYNHNLSEEKLKGIMLDETSNFKVTYFARYAIKYRDNNEVLHGGLTSGKSTLGVGFRYTIIKRFYIESAAYYYPEEFKKQPWDPDFTYGFGYFDWRSFRISLTYGNWAINRFPWNERTAYPHYGFLDGSFRVIANWTW